LYEGQGEILSGKIISLQSASFAMSHCRDISTATVEQGDWQFTSQTVDAFKDITKFL